MPDELSADCPDCGRVQPVTREHDLEIWACDVCGCDVSEPFDELTGIDR